MNLSSPEITRTTNLCVAGGCSNLTIGWSLLEAALAIASGLTAGSASRVGGSFMLLTALFMIPIIAKQRIEALCGKGCGDCHY